MNGGGRTGENPNGDKGVEISVALYGIYKLACQALPGKQFTA